MKKSDLLINWSLEQFINYKITLKKTLFLNLLSKTGSTTVGLGNPGGNGNGGGLNDSRGTADGGFADMPTQDFTTSNPLVIHQHVDDIVRRSPADGKIFMPCPYKGPKWFWNGTNWFRWVQIILIRFNLDFYGLFLIILTCPKSFEPDQN